METKEIGRFKAITFEGLVYEFIVYNNKTLDCPIINEYRMDSIILKPKFELIIANHFHELTTKNGYSTELIKDYIIDDELFKYLKNNNMIFYSTDMAYLYNFIDKDGYDKKRKNGRAFKHARKKGNILEKWKNGEFN